MKVSLIRRLFSSGTMRPFTVVVEGNIGCGKTTFLNHFVNAADNEIIVETEPISEWRNIKGFNLLQLMYENPKKWGFPFQTHVQLTMLQRHMLRGTGQPVKMMERSLHSARYCFVENLWQSGQMETEEKVVLDEWYKWLRDQRLIDVDLIVYLRVKPEIAEKRIKMRAREEEKTVNFETLQNLHNLHENWLVKKLHPLPAPVFILDGEQSLEKIAEEYKRCNNHIREMMVA